MLYNKYNMKQRNEGSSIQRRRNIEASISMHVNSEEDDRKKTEK